MLKMIEINKVKIGWIWLFLLVIGLTVFAGSFDNEFVWDDEEQIVNNQAVHSLGNWPKFFSGSTFNTGGAARDMSGMYYKPLMSLSFALIYSLAGPRPFYFHFFQVSLHILNAGLFYLFLQSLFNNNSTESSQLSNWRSWLNLWLSTIFLIHPVNVETVVYISSLQDVLSLTFGLLAVLIVLRKKLEFKWLLALFICLLFSLLAKETGIIWLIFIPLLAGLAHWVVERPWRGWTWLISGVSFLIYLFLRLLVAKVGFHSTGVSPMFSLNLVERLQSMPKIIGHYFLSYFWPARLATAEHWVVENFTWSEFFLPLILMGILGLILVVMSYKVFLKKEQGLHKIAFIYMLLLILGLGLHLQIFPLDMTVADRWFYVPQLGFLGLLASGLIWCKNKTLFKSKKSIQSLFKVLSILLVLFLAVRSMMRVADWQNGLTLYEQDIKLEPNSFDLSNNYGVELYRTGQKEAARQYFERSTQLAPHWWTNWNNLGVVVEEMGDLELAADYYQRAIDHGQYHLAYQNLSRVKVRQDPASALDFIEESLKLLPNNTQLYFWSAAAHYRLGEKASALEAIKISHQLQPRRQSFELYQLMMNDRPLELEPKN